MNIRLIILIIVGAFLAVRFAMTSTAPPVDLEDAELQTFDGSDGKSLEQIRKTLELIAFASLVAHNTAYKSVRSNFAKDWHAKR